MDREVINIIALLLTVWSIPWKLYAVWTAAKRSQKIWFVVLIVFNTFSILELIYIFKVAGKSWKEAMQDFRGGLQSLKKR